MFRTPSWTCRPWQVREVDETPSTQDLLTRWFEEEPPESDRKSRDFRAVRADVQTSGRGRRGNDWASPDGGLWVSLGWTLDGPPDALVGLVVADCARRVVCTELGDAPGSAEIRTKWPNDLVLDPPGSSSPIRKWGGVVVEVQPFDSRSTTYRVGLGLDLRCPVRSLEVDAPVASILDRYGRSPDATETLRPLLGLLPARLDRMRTDRLALLAELAEDLVPLGETIRFVEQSGSTVANAVDLAEDGSLIIEDDAGRRRIYAAEVERVRRNPRTGEETESR